MVFRGTCVRCTESIWKSWTKSTALVGTFSTSLEELMHAVLAERASLIWESLWCLCLPLIRGLRERQIICQKCPIDLFRNSLSLWQATPFLVGWRKLLAAALSGHSQPADHHLNNNWGEPTYCLKDPVSLVRDWGEDSWPAGTVTTPTWAENTLQLPNIPRKAHQGGSLVILAKENVQPLKRELGTVFFFQTWQRSESPSALLQNASDGSLPLKWRRIIFFYVPWGLFVVEIFCWLS